MVEDTLSIRANQDEKLHQQHATICTTDLLKDSRSISRCSDHSDIVRNTSAVKACLYTGHVDEEKSISTDDLTKIPITCRFETTFVNKERRFPFYDCEKPHPLQVEYAGIANLEESVESKLILEMRAKHKYLILLPEDIKRRISFVSKLEGLLNRQWPEESFTVHAFGSTQNLLCTKWSDLDVCIETEWTELESHICQLSNFMNAVGMKRVECRSQAKVPVVSVYDPVLEITCDMNINNTLALRNTKLIRIYMEIDERAQILTHIVKYWAKNRALNQAVCNTLTSYSWTLMVINFLQTRNPPVLPCLHSWPHEKIPSIHGIDVSFADDVFRYGLKDFGIHNKESVASLLFGFFHHYAYVFNWDRSIVSVRHGCHLPRVLKNWPRDNMFGIEEPFTTTRNLGNTADMGSFLGIHAELQRCHVLLLKGHGLSSFCEPYENRPAQPRKLPGRSSRRDTSSNKSKQQKSGHRHITRPEVPTFNRHQFGQSGLYQPSTRSSESNSLPKSCPGISPGSYYYLSNICVAEHLQYLNLTTYPASLWCNTRMLPAEPFGTTGGLTGIESSMVCSQKLLSGDVKSFNTELDHTSSSRTYHNDSLKHKTSVSSIVEERYKETAEPSGTPSSEKVRADRPSTYASVLSSPARTDMGLQPPCVSRPDRQVHKVFSHTILERSSLESLDEFGGSDIEASQDVCSMTTASSRSSPISIIACPSPKVSDSFPEYFSSLETQSYSSLMTDHLSSCESYEKSETGTCARPLSTKCSFEDVGFSPTKLAAAKETYASKASKLLARHC